MLYMERYTLKIIYGMLYTELYKQNVINRTLCTKHYMERYIQNVVLYGTLLYTETFYI